MHTKYANHFINQQLTTFLKIEMIKNIYKVMKKIIKKSNSHPVILKSNKVTIIYTKNKEKILELDKDKEKDWCKEKEKDNIVETILFNHLNLDILNLQI